MEITINGDRVLTVKANKNNYQSKIKQAVIAAGYDWVEADVSAANWPEKGRYLQKVAGRTQIGAGG